jgi:hypothetical protein
MKQPRESSHGPNGAAKCSEVEEKRFLSPVFLSSAPWQPMFEHRYGFALQMPQMFVDPFGTLWRQIGGIVGKVWTLPNTVVGTTIGLVGTGYGYIDGNPEDPTISFGNNAIQFEKNPFANRPYTLGNATIYSSDQGPDTPTERYDDVPADPNATVGDHERGHTRQYEVLGPLTGPIYLLGGSGAMERAADDYADTGVWSLF